MFFGRTANPVHDRELWLMASPPASCPERLLAPLGSSEASCQAAAAGLERAAQALMFGWLNRQDAAWCRHGQVSSKTFSTFAAKRARLNAAAEAEVGSSANLDFFFSSLMRAPAGTAFRLKSALAGLLPCVQAAMFRCRAGRARASTYSSGWCDNGGIRRGARSEDRYVHEGRRTR